MSSLCGVRARKMVGGNRYDIKRASRKVKRNGKKFINDVLTPDDYRKLKSAMDKK